MGAINLAQPKAHLSELVSKARSGAVEAVILKVKPGELTTSLWTQVELAGLVSRKVRMGELSVSDGDALHPAIAANHGAKRILTLDGGFLEAGRRLNLPVNRGIR